jgi:hypothetical protein
LQGDSAVFKKRLAAIWRDGSEAGALGIDCPGSIWLLIETVG